MSLKSGYHSRVPRWSLPLLLGWAFVLAPSLVAQIHGPRASVTSLGGQFTMFNPPGVRASVTSLGPQGFTPFANVPACCFFSSNLNGLAFDFRRHPHAGLLTYGVPYPVYVPYYPSDIVEPVDTTEPSMVAGPTIFDRRGSRRESNEALNESYDERLSRIERTLDEAEAASKPAATSAPTAASPQLAEQAATVLVFRDGHTVDVKNYAIVADTLFDFSSERHRKIRLTELDLPATEKQNEDRGIDFRLPDGATGN